jgi:hypothetical protein
MAWTGQCRSAVKWLGSLLTGAGRVCRPVAVDAALPNTLLVFAAYSILIMAVLVGSPAVHRIPRSTTWSRPAFIGI